MTNFPLKGHLIYPQRHRPEPETEAGEKAEAERRKNGSFHSPPPVAPRPRLPTHHLGSGEGAAAVRTLHPHHVGHRGGRPGAEPAAGAPDAGALLPGPGAEPGQGRGGAGQGRGRRPAVGGRVGAPPRLHADEQGDAGGGEVHLWAGAVRGRRCRAPRVRPRMPPGGAPRHQRHRPLPLQAGAALHEDGVHGGARGGWVVGGGPPPHAGVGREGHQDGRRRRGAASEVGRQVPASSAELMRVGLQHRSASAPPMWHGGVGAYQMFDVLPKTALYRLFLLSRLERDLNVDSGEFAILIWHTYTV